MPAGDLYVFVHVQAHEFFHREGLDIYSQLNISFSQAALGAEIEVPLLDGKTKVITIPGSGYPSSQRAWSWRPNHPTDCGDS
jgi:molecular chaperone DnaJ